MEDDLEDRPEWREYMNVNHLWTLGRLDEVGLMQPNPFADDPSACPFAFLWDKLGFN